MVFGQGWPTTSGTGVPDHHLGRRTPPMSVGILSTAAASIGRSTAALDGFAAAYAETLPPAGSRMPIRAS